MWQGTIFPPVDGSIQNPSFKPNTISEFNVKGYNPVAVGLSPVSFLIDSFWCQNYGVPGFPGSTNFGAGARMNIEIQQNNIKCSNSQIRGNETKQNYLSCVEDRTKNIKFTKNSV